MQPTLADTTVRTARTCHPVNFQIAFDWRREEQFLERGPMNFSQEGESMVLQEAGSFYIGVKPVQVLLCLEGELEVVVVGVSFGGVLPLIDFPAQVIASRLSIRVLLVKNRGLTGTCRKLNCAVLDEVRERRRIRSHGCDRPLAQNADHTAS